MTQQEFIVNCVVGNAVTSPKHHLSWHLQESVTSTEIQKCHFSADTIRACLVSTWIPSGMSISHLNPEDLPLPPKANQNRHGGCLVKTVSFALMSPTVDKRSLSKTLQRFTSHTHTHTHTHTHRLLGKNLRLLFPTHLTISQNTC